MNACAFLVAILATGQLDVPQSYAQRINDAIDLFTQQDKSSIELPSDQRSLALKLAITRRDEVLSVAVKSAKTSADALATDDLLALCRAGEMVKDYENAVRWGERYIEKSPGTAAVYPSTVLSYLNLKRGEDADRILSIADKQVSAQQELHKLHILVHIFASRHGLDEIASRRAWTYLDFGVRRATSTPHMADSAAAFVQRFASPFVSRDSESLKADLNEFIELVDASLQSPVQTITCCGDKQKEIDFSQPLLGLKYELLIALGDERAKECFSDWLNAGLKRFETAKNSEELDNLLRSIVAGVHRVIVHGDDIEDREAMVADFDRELTRIAVNKEISLEGCSAYHDMKKAIEQLRVESRIETSVEPAVSQALAKNNAVHDVNHPVLILAWPSKSDSASVLRTVCHGLKWALRDTSPLGGVVFVVDSQSDSEYEAYRRAVHDSGLREMLADPARVEVVAVNGIYDEIAGHPAPAIGIVDNKEGAVAMVSPFADHAFSVVRSLVCQQAGIADPGMGIRSQAEIRRMGFRLGQW